MTDDDDADAILAAARAAGAFEATPGGLKEQLARGMVREGKAALHKAFTGNRAQRRKKAAGALAAKRQHIRTKRKQI